MSFWPLNVDMIAYPLHVLHPGFLLVHHTSPVAPTFLTDLMLHYLSSLTLLAFNLIFAQMLAIFPSKHVVLFAVSIFEIGSLLCGVAPNMPVLILGRAIAGLGGTGIFNGALMVLTEVGSSIIHSREPGLTPFAFFF
jgi:MFS family permease